MLLDRVYVTPYSDHVTASQSRSKKMELVANFGTAIGKNGMQRLAQPTPIDVSKYKSDKKIEDEEILKILEQPIGKTATKKKNNKKKKKPAKKPAADGAAAAEEESDDEE